MTEPSIKIKYRPDIDGLRALAILPVVVYHAFPSYAPGGFVGVDIFFVISGYLISLILIKGVVAGNFSFSSFYAHRVKRIFPALLLVLSTCYVFGWFTLLPDEFKQLGKHIAAGIGFIQNFVLWKESGYFDVASELKPLMHLWSLAVEEQFYLFFPVLIWALWKLKINFIYIILLIGFLSFGLNLMEIQEDTIKTFFVPQTRIWELMVGSVIACCQELKLHENIKNKWLGDKSKNINSPFNYTLLNNSLTINSISVLGFLIIVFSIFFYNKTIAYPGAAALLPVLGTAALIFSGSQAFINKNILSRQWMVWVGLISYPLYLWHWPLLSFARIIESDTPSRSMRVLAVVGSFILAAMTYYWIEKRIRYSQSTKKVVVFLIFIALCVGAAGYDAYARKGHPLRDFAVQQSEITKNLKWDDLWDQVDCNKKYKVSPCVESGEDPQVIILGDSHANHIFPGLVQAKEVAVLQAGTCPPLLGVTLYVEKNQSQHPCASNDFLGQNLKVIADSPVKLAIISSFWKPLLNGELPAAHEKLIWGDLRLVTSLAEEQYLSNTEKVFKGLARTIDTLIKKDIDVLLVRDTPDLNGNIFEYCDLRSPLASKDCVIKRADFLNDRMLEDQLIENIKKEFPSIAIVDPLDIFCDDVQCYLKENGVLYFRDQHHLSVSGSKKMVDFMVDKFPSAFP